MTARQERVRTYYPSGRSFVIAAALVPVFILAALPLLRRDDAGWLVGCFIGIPLLVLAGFGPTLHGYCFTFDARTATVTVESRVALIFRWQTITFPLNHLTALHWEEGAEGGSLYMECENRYRFAVTGNRRKAKRIERLVATRHPNLTGPPRKIKFAREAAFHSVNRRVARDAKNIDPAGRVCLRDPRCRYAA